MARRLIIALEQPLEVEKLQEAEKLSAKDMTYDNLYQQVVKNQEDKAKTVESSGSDFSNTDSNDNASEDTGDNLDDEFSVDMPADDEADTTSDETDTDQKDKDVSDQKDKPDDTATIKDNKEESKTDKETNSEENKPAQEDLKNLYTFIDKNVSLEGETLDSIKQFAGDTAVYAGSKVMQGASAVGRFALDKSIDLAKYLGYLGITYGPIALRNMYKGLLYVLFNVVKGLFVSIIALNKFIDKRINNFKNINKKILNLNKLIELKQQEGSDMKINDTVFFHNSNIINKIKIGKSVDLSANITIANKFLNKVIKELDTGINNEHNMINKLIAMYNTGNSEIPFSLMQAMAINLPYKHGIIKGYEINEELLTSQYYSDVLPGDLIFIVTLPKKDINDLDELKAGYKLSNMFFGLNTEGYETVEKIDYMNLQELKGLLDNLKMLVNTCLMHEQHFNNIKKQKLKLRYNFKRYYEHLITSKDKVSLKESMAEFVQLKSHLIDSVYLTAAMNINDYSISLINSYLNFIEKNIKEF